MKKIAITLMSLISLPILTTVLAETSARQTISSSRSKDEAAIKAIIQQLQDGWNAGDGKAFAAPFAEDADYVIVNGMRIKGRDVIASGHQNIFDTIYKNSHNSASIKSIRFLRQDIAIAHVEWNLKYSEGGSPREGKAINSLVLTKESGQWSIAAFHNTPITARR